MIIFVPVSRYFCKLLYQHYSAGQIYEVRGTAQVARDKPLTLFICPTEYTLSGAKNVKILDDQIFCITVLHSAENTIAPSYFI